MTLYDATPRQKAEQVEWTPGETLTSKVYFPSDPRILKDNHRDLVLPVIFLPEPLVLYHNKLLDIPLRHRDFVVVAFTVPTLVGPIGDRDREARQRKENHVSGDSSHHPGQFENVGKTLLNRKRNKENETNEVVIAEVPITVNQTDGRGIVDCGRLRRPDGRPHGKG